MKTKNRKSITIIVLLIILISLLAINIFFQFQKKEKKEVPELYKLEDNPLSINDYSEAKIEIQPTAILLTNNCNAISLSTNPFQSYSIEQGINKNIEYRPLSHDLITEITDNFNIEILMVKISNLKDATYYAELILKQNNEILNLDSRPTDAIAIAVRKNLPVYVKNSLFESGIKVC